MPWLIATDQETLDLLDAAAEMAAAALFARSKRIDEDGVIKRSVDMSRIKMETLRAQMHQSPMVQYPELTEGQRLDFAALCENFVRFTGENERQVLFEQIRLAVNRPGSKEPFARGEKPWSYPDLHKPRVACVAEAGSPDAPIVRRVRRKNRKGDTSQGEVD